MMTVSQSHAVICLWVQLMIVSIINYSANECLDELNNCLVYKMSENGEKSLKAKFDILLFGLAVWKTVQKIDVDDFET